MNKMCMGGPHNKPERQGGEKNEKQHGKSTDTPDTYRHTYIHIHTYTVLLESMFYHNFIILSLPVFMYEQMSDIRLSIA